MTEKEMQLELNKYQQLGFNKDQLIEIQNGLIDGLDVSSYAKLEISAENMNGIRRSLFYGSHHPYETTPEEELFEETEEEKEQLRKEERQKANRELAWIALGFSLVATFTSLLYVINFFK